jgi:hypothetical protein
MIGAAKATVWAPTQYKEELVTQPPLNDRASLWHPMEVLACEPLGRPPVAYGEVLVRMTATPINPSDLIPVAGAYAANVASVRARL